MRPETEAELAEIVAGTSEPLAVQGGGTKGMTPDGVVLTTLGLSGITLYEPGALTIVAQAGTTLAEVEAALDAENQRLAFEPMDYRGLLGTSGEPTIGGVVAANVSGPRRISVGACRDFALGVRYVDGAGQIIKNGGRVMKNVTGYDLVKLMSGARGTLGVLTEVSLKVLPKPEALATVIVHAPADDDSAVRAMSAALGSPYDVTGAAYVPADGQVLVRVEGFTDSVAYRAGQLQDVLKDFGEVTVEASDASAVAWQAIRDVTRMHGVDGDVWRISVKPTDGPAIAARLEALDVMFDWGGGLIWALMPRGTDLRAKLGAFDGHATLVRADAGTRAALGMFQPEPAPVAAISAGLRARFDPKGLLNAGLMG
nr:FAD-binding protein [Aestuariivita boseongensis]